MTYPPLNLDALEALHKAAKTYPNISESICYVTKSQHEFLFAAHTALPALIAECRRLRAENERLTTALRQIAKWDDAYMRQALTLHYDMRGWARDALNEATTIIEHHDPNHPFLEQIEE